jgi:hypothetical protein
MQIYLCTHHTTYGANMAQHAQMHSNLVYGYHIHERSEA